MDNVVAVFTRSWFTYDTGTYGSGAKCCSGKTPDGFCRANSYAPEHSPGCDVVAAAEELRQHGFDVNVDVR